MNHDVKICLIICGMIVAVVMMICVTTIINS